MSWENRLTVGALDDDNGDFEGAGPDGTDIEVGTDWLKSNTACEVDDEGGSGVTTYNGSDFCAKIHTATGADPFMRQLGATFGAAFTASKWYKISYDYKILNAPSAQIRVVNAGGTLDKRINLTSAVWASDRFVFQVVDDPAGMRCYVYSCIGVEDGTEVLWIDNVIIKPHRKRRIISVHEII